MSDLQSPITAMIEWWNCAFHNEAFTAEGFAKHFTVDADFIVDGGLRGTGPGAICAHFVRIRGMCEAVQIVMPPIATLSDATQGFVQYRCTFTVQGKPGSEMCMAHAQYRGNKIARFEVLGRPEET